MALLLFLWILLKPLLHASVVVVVNGVGDRPADDLTDPAPATTFAHLDATTVLSRSIAELGIYPAVDPLDSTSRMLDVRIIGEEHYNTARGVQKVLQVRRLTQTRPVASSLACPAGLQLHQRRFAAAKSQC